MIQLSFQPALDPFHTMFRLLRLRPILQDSIALPIDQVRIIDFYVAFPFRASDIRVKTEHRRFKTAVLKTEWKRPYGDQPDDKIVFARMEPIQEVALQTLASHALISGVQLDRGLVEFADITVPPAIAARIDSVNTRENSLISFLNMLASDYLLTGVGGLKERSGLLEYRYDAV
jgi:hypothetical protein